MSSYAGGIPALSLRTRMLLLFGGGTMIILFLVRLIGLFGVPLFNIKGEFELHTSKAVTNMQIIADQQKRLLNFWFGARLNDLKFFASGELPRLGLQEAVAIMEGDAADTDVTDRLQRANDLARLTDSMKLFSSTYGDYEGMDLVDGPSGVTVASTRAGRVGRSYPNQDLVSGRTGFWDRTIAFEMNEHSGQPSVLFVSPLPPLTGNNRHGFLVLEAPVALFFEQLLGTKQILGGTGESILIDMKRTLLTPLRYPLPDGSIAQPLTYTLNTRAAEFAAWGVDGLVEAVDYRGVPVVSVVRHLRLAPGFAVSMIIKMEQDELYAPVKKSLLASAIILFMGFGLVLLLVVVVSRQLARPLERLSRTAIRIGAGDLQARAPEEGSFEAQALSHTFNAMADKIQKSHEQLEEQVRSRTLELENKNRQLQLEIEEREIAEERIRQSEERFRLAMDATNDGLWDWDLTTGKIYFSPQYYRMLGYQPGELENSIDTWVSLLHPDDRDEALAANNACINNQAQKFNVEFRMRAKDGSYRSILSRGRTVQWDERGQAIKMIGTHVDITERRLLENQLMQSQKMESIGRLAGGIAHDFNNMLAVIFLALELARTRLGKDDPIHEQLDDIKRAAQRSQDITKQLLAFSRKQVISPQPCQLNEMYRGLETSLVRLIGEDIQLRFVPEEELGYILIDPSQMDQVLVNLAINARDAMPDGGTLTVETANVTITDSMFPDLEEAQPGEYIRLTVRDSGRGMESETLENIFEPFFTTKEVGKGTGLGLAMIYGVVKQHQGFIEVESELEKGTTFKLYFPRMNQAPEEKQQKSSDFGHLEVGEEHILLVEDDEILCQMTRTMLEKLGYSVSVAHTPDEALKILDGGCGDYALLLTDVVMPGMNGRELAEIITGRCPDVRVVFMSGYTTDAVVRRGVVEENVDFIQKPFSMKELAAKIREVIVA